MNERMRRNGRVVSTFHPSAEGLAFDTLFGIHPQHDVVTDYGCRVGNFWDGFRREELETVDVQLLGNHDSRAFWKPREENEFRALVESFPEIAYVSGSMICSSISGKIPTGGIYVGQWPCAQCPHAFAGCKLRHVLIVRRADDEDGPPRAIPVGSGDGIFKAVNGEADKRDLYHWALVATLSASVEPGKKGKYVKYTVSSIRIATDEEFDLADAMYTNVVVPYDRLVFPERRVALEAGQETERPALPEAGRHTPVGVTVVPSGEEPMAVGAASAEPTEPEVLDAPPAPPAPAPRNGVGLGSGRRPARYQPVPGTNGGGA